MPKDRFTAGLADNGVGRFFAGEKQVAHRIGSAISDAVGNFPVSQSTGTYFTTHDDLQKRRKGCL